MLGIEINHHRIRMVQVKRRGNEYHWVDAAEIALDQTVQEEPLRIAQRINDVIEQRGWKRQQAVLVLDRHPYVLKRVAAPAGWQGSQALSHGMIDQILEQVHQSMLGPLEHLTFDFCVQTPNLDIRPVRLPTEILAAGAEKKQVDFYAAIAGHLRIKVHAMELPPLASINGLLPYWQRHKEETIAVVYWFENRLDIAIIGTHGILSLQSVAIAPSSEEQGSAVGAMLAELNRYVNTLKLASPQVSPQSFYVAGSCETQRALLEANAALLEQTLAASCMICHKLHHVFLPDEKKKTLELWAFVPALGAAYNGLGVCQTAFNFLHPRGRASEPKKQFSWRPFLFILFGIILIMGLYWSNEIRQRRQILTDLNASIEHEQPKLETIRQAKKDWMLLRSFVASKGGDSLFDGRRRQMIRVLAEISSLFPDSSQAYITDLTVSDLAALASPTTATDISIRGKVSQGDSVPDFIDKLNKSELFQEAKQAGVLAKDATDPLYPTTFSITCNLRRSTGGQKP